MTASHSTPVTPGRPSKPNPQFPLFPHATGYWAKKIRGKMRYFCPCAYPDGALTKYLDRKAALHAGKKPRHDLDALTIKQLANHILNHRRPSLPARLAAQGIPPFAWCNPIAVGRCVSEQQHANHLWQSSIRRALRAQLGRRQGFVPLLRGTASSRGTLSSVQ
jgi:hypothetical protein